MTTDDKGKLPRINFDIPRHITNLNPHTYYEVFVAAAYAPLKCGTLFDITPNEHNNSSTNNCSNYDLMGNMDGIASEDLPTLENL